MILLSGSANPALARTVAERLGSGLAACVLERFPDGELHVEIRESVRRQRVYIMQPTSPPVDEHLFEILLLADACRRAGAAPGGGRQAFAERRILHFAREAKE